MELYNDIKKSRPSDRRNDCSVVSVSIATGTAYDVTEKMFASMGRRFNKGSSIPMITAAVRELTGDNEITSAYVRKPCGGQYTMQTIGLKFPKGKHLVYVNGHVAAMVDGVIHDWTAGRRHRVLYVTTVSA